MTAFTHNKVDIVDIPIIDSKCWEEKGSHVLDTWVARTGGAFHFLLFNWSKDENNALSERPAEFPATYFENLDGFGPIFLTWITF